MKYGLLESQFEEIIKILSSHPEIEEAVLFSSRAIDTFKEASDVDIALKGKTVSHKLTACLQSYFEEETDLPYFFDFVSYAHIDNENLKQHIDKKGVVIYRKGWQTVKLGEMINLNPLEKISKGDIARRILMDDLIPFKKKILNCTNEVYKGGSKFRNGDTIVARITPCLENGKTAFVDILGKNEVGFGSTEFMILRNKPRLTDKHFLYYFTMSSYFRDAAIKSMTGSSGRQRVQGGEVMNLETLLPPLSEQKAIAEVLSSLDDKIELLHEQNKTLEEMAQTLFRKYFIKDTKTHTWPEGKLEEYLETIESGSRPKGGIDPDLNNGIPSIGAESIKGIGHFDFSKTKYITSEFFKTMKKGVVKDYDILIYKDGAYIGKKAMFGKGFPFKEMAVNEHVFILRSNSDTNQFFVYFLLNPKEISKLNTNSAQPGLNQKAMKSLKVKVPPKNMINEFGNIVKPWIDKIFFNSNQIRQLENLRDTLLPKLITGSIRVNSKMRSEQKEEIYKTD